MRAAEIARKPPIADLFTDVYDRLTPALQQQQSQLLEHLSRHEAEYDLEHYKK
jgi:hypothetical protein